jgi:predicted methyltransferase
LRGNGWKRAAAAQLGNVAIVLGRERSVELAQDSIDLAFMCDVYHHLEFPRAYLASVRRALRPGGELVIIDFKRIPGTTKPAILSHVRAGQEVVTREVEQAGFARAGEERGLLEENYLLRFVKR